MRGFSACLPRLLLSWVFPHSLPSLDFLWWKTHLLQSRFITPQQAFVVTSPSSPHLTYFSKVISATTVSHCRLTRVWQRQCDSFNKWGTLWQEQDHDTLSDSDCECKDKYLENPSDHSGDGWRWATVHITDNLDNYIFNMMSNVLVEGWYYLIFRFRALNNSVTLTL